MSSLKLHLGERKFEYTKIELIDERNATDVRWTLANTDHRKDNKIGINGWENLSRLFFINFKYVRKTPCILFPMNIMDFSEIPSHFKMHGVFLI